MDDQTDTERPPDEHPSEPNPAPPAPVRLPSTRWAAVLAVAMLGIGVTVGAAIGPAPESSLAGGLPGIAQRLPLLIAAIGSHDTSAQPTTAAQPAPAPSEPAAAASPPPSEPAAVATTPATAPASEEPADETKPSTSGSKSKLPAITNVWLIQLAGTSFEAAELQPTATPYITGQLLPAATFVKSWSALDASAFASEAALVEPPAAGSLPPILHSIVQPPCPEGAAGAGCAPETPGQLTAADDFLKATLATITGTSTYKEHGLVVVTFSTVGIATQSELPAGASTTQLTYQPPAGAVLLSPFAKAGARSTVAFNPTSPRRSVEALLH
jgi:hypothetical protein